MDEQKRTRRNILEQGVRLPVAGAAILALNACGQGEQKPKAIVCADPNSLSMAENSLRQSGHYAEKSPDASKTCSVCNFFTAGDPPPCGKCEIFQGPVNSGGHCDSWAQKQA